MTGSGTLTSLGGVSKTTFLATEEDKIAIEFTTAAAVKMGQPVKLTNAGLVTPWAKTDLQHLCLGFCAMDAASGGLVTVYLRAFAVIYAISAGAANCGPATYNGYDSTDADTSVGAIGYSQYGAATDVTDAIGWILDQAAGANALMRVALKD